MKTTMTRTAMMKRGMLKETKGLMGVGNQSKVGVRKRAGKQCLNLG